MSKATQSNGILLRIGQACFAWEMSEGIARRMGGLLARARPRRQSKNRPGDIDSHLAGILSKLRCEPSTPEPKREPPARGSSPGVQSAMEDDGLAR